MKSISKIICIGLVAVMAFSCSKKTDDRDITDTDGVGKYELMVDGVALEGVEVTNGAVIGIRTISIEADDLYLGILLAEEDFVAGKTFNVGDEGLLPPTIEYDFDGDGEDEVLLGFDGTIKVVSTDRIELNINFSDFMSVDEGKRNVTGYISSK